MKFGKVKGIILGVAISGVMLTSSASAYEVEYHSGSSGNPVTAIAAGVLVGGGSGAFLWRLSNTKRKARDANKNVVPGASEILNRDLSRIQVHVHKRKN